MADRDAMLRDLGYADRAIYYINNQINYGSIENPTIFVRQQGDCGDVIELYLSIDDGVITEAKYQLVGCAGLQAAGSAVTEIIKGREIAELGDFDVREIIEHLGAIPDAKMDCAETSRDAVQEASRQYRQMMVK